MINKRKGKAITPKDFDLIKTLLEGGLNQTKIGEITGRSAGSISAIHNAEDINAYKIYVANRSAQHKTMMLAQRETKTENSLEPEVNMSYEREILTVLKHINTNLARLADAWEKPAGTKFMDMFRKPTP